MMWGHLSRKCLKVVAKPRLVPKYCVAIRFRMLTYYVYAPLLNRIDALSLGTRRGFETTLAFRNVESN
jgi:hypothetical protein